MTDKKKENLFAKLALQNARATQEEAAAPEMPADVTDPSPAPPARAPATAKRAVAEKPKAVKGKRDNPAYCQANAYVPKSLRKAVDKAILDIDDMDYSTLVEDLLRSWLKSRGVSA